MITIGLDIGSTTTKAAVLNGHTLMGVKVRPTGYNAGMAGSRIFKEILEELDLENNQIKRIITTGYGRNSVDFADKAMSEIMCHGAGVNFTCPGIRTLVDIGGQDSKAIAMDEGGKVRDFAMNDKCAAGTGRFLEVMTRVLEVDLSALGRMSLNAKNPCRISSTCTVFAESEVISLISKGENRSNILAGVNDAIATRVSALSKRVGVTEPVMMTGGVAMNAGLVKAMEVRLGVSIRVFDTAQVNGAIGAAVLARGL